MNGPHCNIGFRQMNKVFYRSLPIEENSYYKLGGILRKNRMVFKRMALYNYITSVFLLSALLNSDEISPYIQLRLYECDFISIRFHDFETHSKSMRFGSVYTGDRFRTVYVMPKSSQTKGIWVRLKKRKNSPFRSCRHGEKYIPIHLD